MQIHYPLNPTTGLEDPSQLPWTNGAPQSDIEGSYPPFAATTEPMTELANLLTLAGLVGSSSDLFQVARAVRSGQLSYSADSGSADALTIGFGLAHSSIIAGLPFTILKAGSGNTSTTPSVQVTGPAGANPITAGLVRRDGSALSAGDLAGNSMFQVAGDASGKLRVLSPVPSEVQTSIRRLPILRTGANLAFLLSDNNYIIRRSNGGAAMQDQLPTLAQVYPGWSTTIRNSDGTGLYTLTTTTTINGSSKPISVPPGVDLTVAIDAAGAWTAIGQPGRPAVTRNSGANQAFSELDRGCLILRSNGGAAMQDSPPGGANVLPNGWFCWVRNVDSVPLVIAPTSTSTINGGTSVTIPGGGDGLLSSDGTNYWLTGLPAVQSATFTAPQSNFVITIPGLGRAGVAWGTTNSLGSGAAQSITLLAGYNSTGYALLTGVLGGSVSTTVSGTKNTSGSIIVTNTGTGSLTASWLTVGALQ